MDKKTAIRHCARFHSHKLYNHWSSIDKKTSRKSKIRLLLKVQCLISPL